MLKSVFPVLTAWFRYLGRGRNQQQVEAGQQTDEVHDERRI